MSRVRLMRYGLALPALLVTGWLLVSPSITRSQGIDVFVNITAGGAKKLNIAVPTFTAVSADPEGFARRTPEIIGKDLTFSALFSVASSPPIPQDQAAQKKYFSDLAGAGAHAALQGFLSTRGDQIDVEARLYDLTSQEPRVISTTKWNAKKSDHRRLAHRLADDVVLQFTGERGIADTKIAFVGKVEEAKELFMIDYDGENLVRLTNTQSTNLQPSWNPDSRSIAFTSYTRGYPYVYRMLLFPFERRQFQLLAGLGTHSSSPAWSPDGKSLLVMASKEGSPDLYVINPVTGATRRLTTHRDSEVDPSWSLTGREIAFVSDRTGSPQIYVMDAEGANTRRLTFEGNFNTQPRWSPKGNLIAYTSRQGSFDIWLMESSGSNPRRLTPGQRDNRDPSWAPNGRHLVFSSNRNGGRWRLFTMLADGTEQAPIPNIPIEATSPAWSGRFP